MVVRRDLRFEDFVFEGCGFHERDVNMKKEGLDLLRVRVFVGYSPLIVWCLGSYYSIVLKMHLVSFELL